MGYRCMELLKGEAKGYGSGLGLNKRDAFLEEIEENKGYNNFLFELFLKTQIIEPKV
jgi:hypothetical protein